MLRPIILKLGGSLLQHSDGAILLELGKILAQYSAEHPALIVPGGGPFADLIRQYGAQLKLREETCHLMALSAMDQYAYLLQDFIPGCNLIDLAKIKLPLTLNNLGKPQVLLCSQFFSKVSSQELPRSWDVTSDSLAVYLAKILDSPLLVILKSKDIDPRIQEPDVDKYFPQSLPFSIPVWFINGVYPDRLIRFFETGSTQGVYLPPNNFTGQLTV